MAQRKPRVPRTTAPPTNGTAPKLRVSQIVVTLVLIDEYDALKNADPLVFTGDVDGSAAEKATAFLTDSLPQLLNTPPEIPQEPVSA